MIKKYFSANATAIIKAGSNKNLSELQVSQGITSRLVEVFAILGFCILVAVNKLAGRHAIRNSYHWRILWRQRIRSFRVL